MRTLIVIDSEESLSVAELQVALKLALDNLTYSALKPGSDNHRLVVTSWFGRDINVGYRVIENEYPFEKEQHVEESTPVALKEIA